MKKLFLSSCLFVLWAGSLFALDCKRTIQVVSGKEMHVEITIRKDQMNGFARLAEYMPEGAEIKYAKTEGGTFDIQGKRLKFIWIALPQKEEFSVSYTLSTENLKEGSYAIYGKFNYVDGDETKEYEIASSSFEIAPGKSIVLASASAPSLAKSAVAPVATKSPLASASAKSAAPAVAASAPTVSASAPAMAASASAVTASTASATNSGAKIVYGLQLLTTKEKLASDYFATKYGVKQKVNVDVINGLNKYVITGFKSSAEAQAYREELAKKGCTDSFLVAYHNNQRVTMDEAKKLEGGK
jgi:hypothetical protein